MLHHNISGNVLNDGNRISATVPLRQAVNQWGAPIGISLNESCYGQTEYMKEWLGINYTSHFVAQVVNVPSCASNGQFGYYGVGVIATQPQPNPVGYNGLFDNQVAGDERRAWVCRSGGVDATKGFVCSTHLQNFDAGVKRLQWGEYCDKVKFVRDEYAKPVNFAGDTYETWPMLRDICANKGVSAIDADPQARPTWRNNAGQGLQVDHVAGLSTQPRPQIANLLPPEGQPYPNLSFLSDHRLVASYIDFDG